MVRRTNRAFTLIELMMVVALIVIIATVGIPNLLSSRLTANETSAIATLKAISLAQSQALSRGAIDNDDDGQGEYLYLGELSGRVELRGEGVKLEPAIISVSLGILNQSCANKAGYLFKVYLPDATGAGVSEDDSGGKAVPDDIDADLCETYWVAYAWPSAFESSGRRAFAVNQTGTVLATSNDAQQYSGISAVAPDPDAAYSAAEDMTSKFSVNGVPDEATDGGLWIPIN